MSSIAYITDSKMLEMHRVNNHQTINFWRLSSNVNFSDFQKGDLVFFLSKDKEHKNTSEKGIVGYGRLKSIECSSVTTMWQKYGIENGYKNKEDFKLAIMKVSKDHKIPSKISSFYLEDVLFFRPIYLSECGVSISNNVESYIYLKTDVTLKLLELAKSAIDPWSFGNEEDVYKQIVLCSLFAAHKKIGDIPMTEKGYQKAKKAMRLLPGEFIQNSRTEKYQFDGGRLHITMYFSKKETDRRMLLGQMQLYNMLLKDLCDIDYSISEDDKEMKGLINSLKL